jgi:S-adenosylmethionine:tRNA ribosyltransferase-isomerase
MDEFDYDLPTELIAQEPELERDASRLMVLAPRATLDGVAAAPPPQHRIFADLPDLLVPGDLLVMNDTRVLAARVEARRPTGGAVELLFIAPEGPAEWRALARPAKRIRVGEELRVGNTRLNVTAELDGGLRRLRFAAGLDIPAWLDTHGQMPLPPYIHPEASAVRERFDRERYQTVYASVPGAVAAPTAGLHFTSDLLERLAVRGVEIAFLTLDVGPGTFRPVTAERVADHRMDGEAYRLPESTAVAVNRARSENRRVVAVGTTSVRALEHAAGKQASREASTEADATGRRGPGAPGAIRATEDVADIFVSPGYRFRVVSAMITNLHLPRSTPILLAAALVGRERLLAAYAEAIKREYRFYSYGDAMLLQ